MSGLEREEAAEVAPHPASFDDAFRLGGEPPKVMRLSRKALASLGAASGIAIGAALLYALQPTKPKVAESLYDSDRANKSEVVTGAPGDYGKIPKLGEPLPGDLGRPILAAREAEATVPVPPAGTPPPPDPRAVAAGQARARAAQERESARASQLFLAASSTAASSASLPGAAPPQPVPAALMDDGTGAGRRRVFLAGGRIAPPESSARIVKPSSPRVVQAGSVIPAALITGIRSDLPGQVSAQITQNVYDSPTGTILLIPQGARLIGEYDSDIVAGQQRLLLAWDRLILPGGRSIRLDRQPGADAQGMAGISDRTDNHWGRMLRAGLLSTLLGIGTELAADRDDALLRALRDGAQDSVNEAGRRLVEREMKVPPTLTIRPGYIFRVIVTRDLILDDEKGPAR